MRLGSSPIALDDNRGDKVDRFPRITYAIMWLSFKLSLLTDLRFTLFLSNRYYVLAASYHHFHLLA